MRARMNFNVVPMTEEHAGTIAAWRFEGMYAFYDWDADPEDLDELSDPLKRALVVQGEISP